MVTLDRQEVMATNKSLRLIKTELESLLEKGVITDDAFDQIHSMLPSESSLAGRSSATPASARSAVASPPPQSPHQQPPTAQMANLAVSQNPSPGVAPPSYSSTGPPSLPARNNPAPPPEPQKPVIAHARAMYRYTAADERDLSFERDDKIQVHEYMNDDWWMGRNARSGAEGIFPKNYVQVDHDNNNHNNAAPYANEKAAYHQPPPANNYYGPPAGQAPWQAQAQPPPQNPYNSSVPPMAVAEGSGEQKDDKGGKMGKHGKNIGKKLGNAAVFGAGATIGSNLVNSIF